MANERTGKNQHQRAGRADPSPTGERVADDSAPREEQAEPGSGARRDPLPSEYKRERASGDVPGLRKKIR